MKINIISLLLLCSSAFKQLLTCSGYSSTFGTLRPFRTYAAKRNYLSEPPESNQRKGKPHISGGRSSSLDNRNSEKQLSPDPWKILMTKLDNSKKHRENVVGKVERKSVATVDELKCPHFNECSGCTIQGNFSSSPIVSRAKDFFAREGMRCNVIIGKSTKWRTHAKLAVQPLSRWGGLKIGLYKAASKIVEPIPDCTVHHPKINIAVEEIRLAAIDAGVTGYQAGANGQPSQGDLRYLQLSLERTSNKIQLVLVWNAPTYKDCGQSLQRFVKRLKSRADIWHSITANFQTSSGDVIFNYQPRAWKLLWGPATTRETVGAATFFFQPQIFRQANIDAFETGIIPAVVRQVPPGSKVAELYSGVGLLGLNIVAGANASEVLCSDSNEFVDAVFDQCADSLPEEHQENVFFENLSAEDAVAEGQCDEAEVIVVDPPRKGLDEGVLQLLLGTHESASAKNLKRLVYVSCSFESLERDARALLDSGSWRLKAADAFVLFPGSDHVETVVVFDKKTSISVT